MGNKWETKSKETKSFKCPCRKGNFYIHSIVIEDDYLREKCFQEEEWDCVFCSDRFIFIDSKFRFKKVYNLKFDFKNRIEALKCKLRDELYNKYINKLVQSFSSKKKLYEFLYDNRLVYICGSLSTFYKDGYEYYISREKWSLEKLECALEILNRLDKEDIEKINKLKNEIDKIKTIEKKEIKIVFNKEKEDLEKYKNEL